MNNKDLSKTLIRYNYIEGGIDEQYRIIAAFLGLSDSAFNILYVLYEEGGSCPQSILYKNSGMSRKTAGSSLRKLEEEGILQIEKGPQRGNNVTLTEKGRELASDRIVPVIKAENHVFASWTPEEREAFLRLGNRYLNELADQFKELRSRMPQKGFGLTS